MVGQHWFNVLVLAGALQFEHLFPFERLIQVLNGLFQEEQFSSLNAVQNAVFIPKAKIVQNGRSEREAF